MSGCITGSISIRNKNVRTMALDNGKKYTWFNGTSNWKRTIAYACPCRISNMFVLLLKP